MSAPLQPIYLFADSQLLFWKDGDAPFLRSVTERLDNPEPKAAYVGASNGDEPAFYSIFEAAMDGAGVRHRRMIPSAPSADDLSFIRQADIILLAGGDVERGWQAFGRSGLNEMIPARYYEGALLMGVSAGAVQLGLYGLVEEEPVGRLIDTFKLVPFVVSAHDEKQEWRSLAETIQLLNGAARGLGIPMGAGLIYYPDHSVRALRHALSEFSMEGGTLRHSLILPDAEL